MDFTASLTAAVQPFQAAKKEKAQNIIAVEGLWRELRPFALSLIEKTIDICSKAGIETIKEPTQVAFSLRSEHCGRISLSITDTSQGEILASLKALGFGGEDICKEDKVFYGEIMHQAHRWASDRKSCATFDEWFQAAILFAIGIATNRTEFDIWKLSLGDSKKPIVPKVGPWLTPVLKPVEELFHAELMETRRLLTSIYYRLDRLK